MEWAERILGGYLLHNGQRRAKIHGDDRRRGSNANKGKLEEGIVFANGGGVDLGGGQGEIPVSGKGLRRW